MIFSDTLYNKSGQLVPQRVYQEFNRLYFRKKLPEVPVRWSKSLTQNFGFSGVLHYGPLSIFLNPRLKGCDKLWAIVLLHEMVHVEQRDLRISHHGRKFQNRMKQLAARGAFQDLW